MSLFVRSSPSTFPWASPSLVPDPVFLEYVLPYAALNEPRTNWRPLLLERLAPLLQEGEGAKNTEEVVEIVNGNVWDLFDNKTIVFKSRSVREEGQDERGVWCGVSAASDPRLPNPF